MQNVLDPDAASIIFDRVTTAVLGNFTGVKASAQALSIIKELKEALEIESGSIGPSNWAVNEQVRRILENKY